MHADSFPADPQGKPFHKVNDFQKDIPEWHVGRNESTVMQTLESNEFCEQVFPRHLDFSSDSKTVYIYICMYVNPLSFTESTMQQNFAMYRLKNRIKHDAFHQGMRKLLDEKDN